MCDKVRRVSGKKRRAKFNLLVEKQGLFCCYCERDIIVVETTGYESGTDAFPANMATLEHLHRIDDGGKNNIGNLALACFACNKGRGTIDWLTYRCYKMGEITL